MVKYSEAIKSAQTKFDHYEEYFKTDGKPIRYINEISNEVLNDIAVDPKNKFAMK